MNIIAESSVEIHSNIDDTFAYIRNMENFSEWFPEVIDIKSIDSQPHGEIGKKYIETIKIPFKGVNDYSIEVKESKNHLRFVTEGEVPPIYPRMTISFTQISQAVSKVEWKMASRNKNFLFNVLLLPCLKRLMLKRAKQGMLNLKHILEK